MINKKLSQICTHFQTKGVDYQNSPNWILQNFKEFIYASNSEI